ncbi:pyridoxal 5'-phosphate synthase [Pseudoalteromonas luteoviolacea]|uniref:pyridoxine/pyridoxamine 5'-phosphate oxidase n=1 Tax=Pseudoalteromonas luteoviolacea TaxID=43657 RepID=UPI001EEF1E40|nr:pyridoxal 5'-phosphate synthase [Pseudoalteromonas luteoviolacea]MCF6443015.1 pyridoxal 5'-phosphate synthase [Pseudoalteromonas luteoviolacea]
MDSPINKFKVWWQESKVDSPLKQKSAVCVSTIDEHGFPSGRFVDLKAVSEEGFVFCSYFDSAKGKHISHNPKSAMTFWWDHVGYQVRVIGHSQEISELEADSYWVTRTRSAQLTTTAFDQSAPLESEAFLDTRLNEALLQFGDQSVPRPKNWGGYIVKPVSIEFLTFRESRLHLRELYENSDGCWNKQLLQP